MSKNSLSKNLLSKNSFHPANAVQDLQFFGEFGGVNPSITDSSTYTYFAGKTMEEVFGGSREGCYLYSRHLNPSASYLAQAVAGMEKYGGSSSDSKRDGGNFSSVDAIVFGWGAYCEFQNDLWWNLCLYEAFFAPFSSEHHFCGYQ